LSCARIVVTVLAPLLLISRKRAEPVYEFGLMGEDLNTVKTSGR